MADDGGSREAILKVVVQDISRKLGYSLILKEEQKTAVKKVMEGKDVLAVLPTGYGKSLIFQLLVLVSQNKRRLQTTALVVCPLNSIIQDQIEEAKAIGIKACNIADIPEKDVCKYQLLFGSAEKVLGSLKLVKQLQNVVAVIIDESHIVETWTGLRSKDIKGAFRESFAHLSTLRSFCKGTPLLALTGTADSMTQKTIISKLAMNNPVTLAISPNRCNLRISVVQCQKEETLDHLSWLINMIKEERNKMPKTIIFCNGTLNDIAKIFNYLLLKLGDSAYVPNEFHTSENCIIGIYHSLTLPKHKERVVDSFKEDGKKRIVIASSALSMGINFPNVRFVIHWGPPRNLLDYHQESGRAGRDNKPSDVIVIFHGQQLSHCEQDVKDFVRSESCYRISAYKPFDKKIKSLTPPHDCCTNCTRLCKCCETTAKCSKTPVFELEAAVKSTPLATLTRPISPADKEDLVSALEEMVEFILPSLNVNMLHQTADKYSKDLVPELVKKSHTIFAVSDITDHLPVFSIYHALRILEVFQEIFEDIPNIDAMVEVFGREETRIPEVSLAFEKYNFEESDSDSSELDLEDQYM